MEDTNTISVRVYQDDIRSLVLDHDSLNLLAAGKLRKKTWDIVFVDFVGYEATGSTRRLTFFDYLLRLRSPIMNKMHPTKKMDLLEYPAWLPQEDMRRRADNIRANDFVWECYRDSIQN